MISPALWLLGALALLPGCGAGEGPVPSAEAGSDPSSGLGPSTDGNGGSEASTGGSGTGADGGTAGSGAGGANGGSAGTGAASADGIGGTAGSGGALSSGSSATGDSSVTGGSSTGGGTGGNTPHGERCDDARPVLASDEVFAGPDFTADYAGDLDLADHESCRFGDDGSSDAVFSVEMKQGDTLIASQTGSLEAILSVQTACGAEKACSASNREGAGNSVEYTASTAETVFVIVDALEVAPSAADYELRIDIDPVCGNGALEAREQCDDGGLEPDDGCSPSCTIEFPFMCSKDSPSDCELPESLGTAGAPVTLSRNYSDTFDGPHLYYIVTFTERVLVDVAASTNFAGTGDIDIVVYRDWDDILVPGIGTGDAWRPDEAFEPGTYLIELRAVTDLPYGFTLELTVKDAGACGDEVVQTGFEECDNGGHGGCEDCQVAFDHFCSDASPSVCTAITGFGPYAAGDPIAPVATDAEVIPQVPQYWLIDFSEDVKLSGSVTFDAGAYEYLALIRLWSEDSPGEPLFESDLYYYPTFGDWEVPAGRYKIELISYSGLPAGYVLTLETTAL